MDLSQSNPTNQKIFIFAGAGVLVLLFIIFIVITQVAKSKPQTAAVAPSATPTPELGSNNLFGNPAGGSRTLPKTGPTTEALSQPPKAPQTIPGALAKIGDEIIYNTDLNEELAAYPPSDDSTVRTRLFQKMVDDSITLQGAQKMKLITLDSSVYNSNTKDYNKRIKAVSTAKAAIDANADGYSGTIVQIWFYNQKPPRVGYEQGKQMAAKKITEVYNQVKSGTMTMDQAGDAIRADSSLYDVDEAFRVNASFPFQATKEHPATFDDGFNAILAGMKVGQVSSIYTAKDDDENGNKIEALYMFGKIDSINSKGGYTSFSDWLAKQRKNYAVVTY